MRPIAFIERRSSTWAERDWVLSSRVPGCFMASRRVDARAQLRAAHEQLTSLGMEAFAERARRELLATGEKVRKRTVETRDELTPQEQEIARLARDGLSNPEIGARLFLSPRTVEWHLRKVFTKLEIRSRRELSGALPSSESEMASRLIAAAATGTQS